MKLFWRLMVKAAQVREFGRWILVNFLWQIESKKKIYRLKIFQQMRCREIWWKIQRTEQSLGNLETTYLAETNKAELVSEKHGKKKYTQKWDNVLLFDIRIYNQRQEFFGKYRKIQEKLERWVFNFYVKYSILCLSICWDK